MIIKTLDRYIVRTFLHSLLMWFIVMMVLRIVVDLFRQMDEFTESSGGLFEIVSYICSYYFYNSFVYFTQMGGMMIVAAAAFTMARMNHTNELTAMLASGVSLHRVVWPIILCAMIMGGLIVVDQEFIIPNVRLKLARSADGQDRDERFQVRFFADGNQTVWWASNYSPAAEKMEHPLVIFRDDNFKYLGHMIAQEAVPGIFTSKDGREQEGWVAKDGEIGKIASPGEQIWRQTQKTNKITTTVGPDKVVEAVIEQCKQEQREVIPTPQQVKGAKNLTVEDPEYNMTIRAERFIRWPIFGTRVDPQTGEVKNIYGLPVLERPKFEFRTKEGRVLATVLAESAVWRPDESLETANWELTDGRIFHATDLTPGELKLRQSGRWLDYMSSSELTSLLQLKRTNDPRAVRMTKYIRFSDPLNNLIMLLLGLPFILSRQRNIKASAGLCILMVGMFYVFIYICRYMGLPDFWAAFLPVLIFGPVSVLMLDSIKT